ncbi:DUF167 domain-containing protein [Legionella sp. W05-934-2]|jgi:uncharacterized protein (TIGR00251 family)|uniref:DUF167 domain-containing protein n=1 Tax=Legionella sp. W05-934-2 TaxID=1198649 RepID=UPI003461AA83
MTWYCIKDKTIVLNIWAKPNAKITQFVAIDERGIHVAIQAKPDEGKANKALVAFIANQLSLTKNAVTLLRGSKSRHKQIVVDFDEAIVRRLEEIKGQLLDRSH